MTGYLIEMFAVSLALTVLTELVVVYFLLRIRNTQWIQLVVLVNVLTNPPAVLICWLGRMCLPSTLHFPLQIAVELVVIAAEAAVYHSFSGKSRWKMKDPLLLSISTNGCSYLIGILFMALR